MSIKPCDKAAEYKALIGYIIDQWEDERDQVFALVSCIEIGLRPKDPKAISDGDKFNEWRIAQVIAGMLEECASLNASRRMVEGVNHG